VLLGGSTSKHEEKSRYAHGFSFRGPGQFKGSSAGDNPCPQQSGQERKGRADVETNLREESRGQRRSSIMATIGKRIATLGQGARGRSGGGRSINKYFDSWGRGTQNLANPLGRLVFFNRESQELQVLPVLRAASMLLLPLD